MMTKTNRLTNVLAAGFGAVGFAGGLVGAAAAAPFSPGNLAVERLGDGTQTLGNTGNTASIDQYTPAGTLVNTTLIPDSGTSALIVSGSATSEGALSRSADGRFLVLGGYNTNRPAGSSLAGGTSATFQRAAGTVDAAGTFTLIAATNTQFSANNIRSAVTDGGANVYAAGGNSGTVLMAGNGSTGQAGSAVQTAVANTRVNNIFNGNLYFSTGSGTPGVFAFAGTPTAAAAATQIITSPGASPSPYDFVISPSGTTAYVADDRTIANGGGIERFDLSGGTFALTYTLGTGAGSTVGARGLAVDFSGATPVVYATTAETSGNRLISIVDAGGTSAATTLATAGTNQIFRGLDFTPVPEPAGLGLLAAGGLLLARRRRAGR